MSACVGREDNPREVKRATLALNEPGVLEVGRRGDQPSRDLAVLFGWLDDYLRRAFARFEALAEAGDPLLGAYISPQQVARGLAVAPGTPRFPPPDAATALPGPSDGTTRLDQVAAAFALPPFAQKVLLIALAPEHDTRYERLYAYLQDDANRRRPSVGLALDLLCRDAEERLRNRRQLGPESALLANGLVRLVRESDEPELAARLLPAPPITAFVLDLGGLDAALAAFCRLEPLPASADAGPTRRPEHQHLHLIGPVGSGRLAEARGLATAMGCPLLRVDLALLKESDLAFATALLWLRQHLQLHPRLACLENLEAISEPADERRLVRFLNDLEGPVVILADEPWAPVRRDEVVASIRSFRGSVAASARARLELDRLAQLLPPLGTLDDLVLPPGPRRQLDQLLARIRHRGRVLDAWGFASRCPQARGVSALMAGPPGAGKTMAASAIGHTTGLPVFRIDLAQVVSKYIGETERNLATLFATAQRADVILFFDEAEALFGKRSEVRDAHDRYANLEIAYLLQRLETHEGVVLLATNLRQHLDEAFLRRLQLVIDFPLPGEAERERLFRTLLPEAAPRSGEMPLKALGQAVRLSGGHIQNIVLAAAFAAAAEDRALAAGDVWQAAAEEHAKLGRPWSVPAAPGAGGGG